MILTIFNFPTPIYLLKHIWCRNSSDLFSVKATGSISLKKTSQNKHASDASITKSPMCAHLALPAHRRCEGVRCDSVRAGFGILTRLLVQDNWTYSHYLLQVFEYLELPHAHLTPAGSVRCEADVQGVRTTRSVCENNAKLSVTKFLPANLDDTYSYQTKDPNFNKTPLVVPYVFTSNLVTPSLASIWDSYVDIAVKMYDADISSDVGFLPNSNYGLTKRSFFDLELTDDLKVSGSITKGKLPTSCKDGWKTYCYDSSIGARIILPILTPTPSVPAFPSWKIASHMPLWTLVPRCHLGISHMSIFSQEPYDVFETKNMWPVSQLVGELGVETGKDDWFFHINNYLIKLFKQQYMTHLSSLNGSKQLERTTTCLPKVTSSDLAAYLGKQPAHLALPAHLLHTSGVREGVRCVPSSEVEGFLFLPLGLSPTKAQMRLHLNELRQCIRLARTSTQSNLIEKLTPWIRAWKDYYTFPDFLQLSPVIEGVFVGSTTYRLDLAKQANISLVKMLWRWACRRHPKKNRQWIKSKYFHSVKEKKGVTYLTKKVMFSVCQTSGTYRCLLSH